MKTIPLTQGKVALVDDADYKELSKHKWCARKVHNSWYALRANYKNGKTRVTHMHRVIMKPLEGMDIDHRDGDGLNNCRYNMRICTHAQNQRNQRIQVGKTSKYKGVYWDKSRNKWAAGITLNDRKKYLGRYKVEIEAANAYDKAAIEFFGEFALLNFPMGVPA